MSDLRQAAQQALEALKDYKRSDDDRVSIALHILHQALAEPETEVETYKRLYELRGKALDRPCSNCGYQPERIYPMAVAELEQPVAWVFRYSDGSFDQPSLTEHSSGMIPLYTAPTPRKPLTDEEIALISGECAASAYRHDDFSFARAVIAAYEAKQGEQT